MAEGDEDKVGYRRPPKAFRFKPGQSGNPKGRPKGLRAFNTDLREVLSTRVQVTKDGKRKRVSAQVAGPMRLTDAALSKGDIRALMQFLGLAQAHGIEDLPEQQETELSADDAAIIERFLKRQIELGAPKRTKTRAPKVRPKTNSTRKETKR